MRRFALVAAALSVAACQGKVSSPGTGGDPGSSPGPSGSPSGPGSPGSPGGGMTMEPAGPPPPPPYEAIAPASYAAKVKDLLTGLPLTEQELAAVTANRGGAAAALIDGWAQTPQFKERDVRLLQAGRSSRPSWTSPTSTISCASTAPTSTAPISDAC